MALDVLQETIDVLSTNWTPDNTDGKTPVFKKITEVKRYDYGDTRDLILIQRSSQTTEHAGIGDSPTHEFDNFNLDIRVLGKFKEGHWLNVIEEAKRVIDSNHISPFASVSEVHTLDFTGDGIDLSNKNYNLWRKMLPIQFKRYLISR